METLLDVLFLFDSVPMDLYPACAEEMLNRNFFPSFVLFRSRDLLLLEKDFVATVTINVVFIEF
jgi:hypothetical protein